MSATLYENGDNLVCMNDKWCWADTLKPMPQHILNEWKDRCSGDGWFDKE